MNADFQPLVPEQPPNLSGEEAFRLEVLSSDLPAGALHASAPANSSQRDPSPNSARPPVAPGSALREPKLTLEREGDRVSRILVQCSCGQILEIDCDYAGKA